MNLLEETIEKIDSNNKKIVDVVWVGSINGKYAINWEEFEKIANVEYDAGFGAQKIAEDLVVVGDNWWLERHEYDGSEWWEFKEIPKRKEIFIPFKNIGGDDIMWESLEEINKEGDKE